MGDEGDREAQKKSLDVLVGLAVRSHRNQAGLTLSELSERSGVSTPMISKIERGQVSASLSTLNALASAVGVPIINFFAATVEIGEVSLVRAGEGISVRRAGSTYGHNYKQIGRIEIEGQSFESYLITLENEVTGTPIFLHPGVELMHFIEGALSYRVGAEIYDLKAGDTLTFQATVPHGPVRMESARVQFLTVISRTGKNFT
ncbi:XRE family transcriptional regulator [Salipiger sp. P9]|uniref:helix-turn-helix domain-containing protein n=1 Tax=Salipiger pentaromativorans TaxID=2943193 RepID=UPI002157BEFD|nr:XRE family transcriptional regulator [Salipiger pentaromativorans]MCR8550546.1 XRE family transcriptional regulator [Salipiger pentaromativorans]